MMITDVDFEPTNYDHSDGDGLATGKFQLLRGIKVIESPDQDVAIKDGASGVQVDIIPSGAVVGQWIESGEVKCVDGIYVDWNSATTGTISIRSKKYVKGA